ncbi:Ig-like domain-containing protein [Streptomyces sp. NPDC001941]|uniref:Ig-like domain-containing protein n=1 Tax=Streptomyces sp. NPDC001941 TaxID=3154659 RepID=UPI003320C8C6
MVAGGAGLTLVASSLGLLVGAAPAAVALPGGSAVAARTAPAAGALARAVTDCAPANGFALCKQYDFEASGDQTFTVPAGVTSINATLRGAGSSEAGGRTVGDVAVSPGQNVTVMVGEAGGEARASSYGGGGFGGTGTRYNGVTGGGMSALWTGASLTGTPILIAGGGGGRALGGRGGAEGGGTSGADAPASANGGTGAGGGTQSQGGAAATTPANACATAPTAGAKFRGGNGGFGPAGADAGGGGGGGWYGGGGGTCQENSGTQNSDSGGGGGSGYTGGPGVSNATTTVGGGGPAYDGTTYSPGQVTIRYNLPLAVTGPQEGGDLPGENGPVTGTGTPGSQIVIKDKDGNELCSTTVAADGSWTCTVTKKLPCGPNELDVVQTKPDGTTETVKRKVNVTDPCAKDVAIDPPAGGTPGTGPLTGTGEPGATVELTDKNGNPICSTTVRPDGTWSCTPSAPLPCGDNEVNAKQTTTDGYTSTSQMTISVTQPCTKPVDITGPKNGSNFPGTGPVRGTGTPGSTVTVKDKDGNTVCTATVAQDGTWGCTPTKPLPCGKNVLSAEQKAPGAAVTRDKVSVNVTAPCRGRTPSIDHGGPVGPTGTLRGKGEPGAKIAVKDKFGNVICRTTVKADGTWTCAPRLAPGCHILTPYQTIGTLTVAGKPVRICIKDDHDKKK